MVQSVKNDGSEEEKVLTPRRENTRKRLIDAARQLFIEKGIAGTSVEDISDVAGFTRGAFYSNFNDKEDILVSLSEQEFQKLEERLMATWREVDFEGQAEPRTFQAFTEKLMAALDVNREFYLLQTELALYLTRHPQMRDQLIAPRNSFMNRFETLLVEAVDRAGRIPSTDPHIGVWVVSSLLRHVVENSIITGQGHTDEETLGDLEVIIPLVLESLTEDSQP